MLSFKEIKDLIDLVANFPADGFHAIGSVEAQKTLTVDTIKVGY